MIPNIYTPLSEAVRELQQRREFGALQKKIRDEIQLPNQLQVLFERPHLVMFRQVLTPLTETLLFLALAKKYSLTPFVIEFYDDKFVSTGNPYKRGLGKLPIHKYTNSQKTEAFEYMTIVSFNDFVGKELKSVKTVKSESLIDLHHEIFHKITQINPQMMSGDGSDWFKSYGTSDVYYKMFLRLFVRDAILFETFLNLGEELKLTNNTVMPAFEQCITDIGLKPLIVHATYEDTESDPEILNYYPKITRELLLEKGYS